MGPVLQMLERMGFLLCLDAVPAFHGKHKGAKSLLLAELINMSLRPDLRYDPDNMMCWLIIPEDMSTTAQLKFFKYLCKTELNPLQDMGVPGPDGPVKFRMFGANP